MKKMGRILVLLLILSMSISTVAFASVDDSLADLDAATTTESTELKQQLKTSIDKGDSWVKTMITNVAAEARDSNKTIIIGTVNYYARTGYTDKQVIDRAKQALRSANATGKTNDITDGLNISADTTGASEMMKGFIPIVNLVLGVIVVLITTGLAVFTAFDVCYITMPVFRNKCEDAKAQGSGPMVAKTANGGTKLRFVTDEAIFAVNNCSLESGKNPLTAYLGKRVVAFVAVAIILFILLTGNISVITNIALKLVSGLMDVLQSLS